MFLIKIGNEIKVVTKINKQEFTDSHHKTIAKIQYKNGNLTFSDTRWAATFLGAGEEKAVFGICDEHNRIFALEVIDERTYLNGRFINGTYFYETTVSGLHNVKFSPQALVGLTFTGLVKAREYVHGYEWAHFQFSARKHSWFDGLLTIYLQSIYGRQFNSLQSRYKDVHDRNIMFEIKPISGKGAPILIKDWLNKLHVVKIDIQPIDVR